MKLIAGDAVHVWQHGAQLWHAGRGEVVEINESRVWLRMDDGRKCRYRFVDKRGGCFAITREDNPTEGVLYMVEEQSNHAEQYQRPLL